MDHGRRSMYTEYFECHYLGEVVYVRRKARLRKKDGWYEYKIIRSMKTIEKAKEDGYTIQVIKDVRSIPFEVEDEVARIKARKNEKAERRPGRTA